MLPTIPAYEPYLPYPRSLGAHSARSPGLYPNARIVRCGAGSSCPASRGNGVTGGEKGRILVGAAVATLARFVAAAVERSTPGLGPTASP
jgi:hypothetical protein